MATINSILGRIESEVREAWPDLVDLPPGYSAPATILALVAEARKELGK